MLVLQVLERSGFHFEGFGWNFRRILGGFGEGLGRVWGWFGGDFWTIFCFIFENRDLVKNSVFLPENHKIKRKVEITKIGKRDLAEKGGPAGVPRGPLF